MTPQGEHHVTLCICYQTYFRSSGQRSVAHVVTGNRSDTVCAAAFDRVVAYIVSSRISFCFSLVWCSFSIHVSSVFLVSPFLYTFFLCSSLLKRSLLSFFMFPSAPVFFVCTLHRFSCFFFLSLSLSCFSLWLPFWFSSFFCVIFFFCFLFFCRKHISFPF